MSSRSEAQSSLCAAVKRNGYRCRAWALRGELLCKAHHPLFNRSVECHGGPLDGVVVAAFGLGPVFYALPVDGEEFPARIVDAGMRPFPWHRISGAYVLERLGNFRVLRYDWFEAAALRTHGVARASRGGVGGTYDG